MDSHLPHQSVGVGPAQLIHHQADCGSHLMICLEKSCVVQHTMQDFEKDLGRIRVSSVHDILWDGVSRKEKNHLEEDLVKVG